MKFLNIVGAVLVLSFVWIGVDLLKQHQATGKLEVKVAEQTVHSKSNFESKLVHPRARPSQMVEIGHHWIWAHELVDCALDAGPLCIQTDLPAGLSDVDLTILNILGGEDI